MAILRVHHECNYTMINNGIFRDTTLSFKAKGILCYMLSCKDDWNFNISSISKMATDGYTKVSKGLQELEDHGYLKRIQTRSNDKISGIEYDVYESPQKQLIKNQVFENQILENQELIINNDNNKELKEEINKEITTEEELTLEELFEKEKSKKDLKTLIKWTKLLVTDEKLIDALILWLKQMLVNNKWQMVETYRKKLQELMNSVPTVEDAITVVEDATDKNYCTFKYSIENLRKKGYNKTNNYEVKLERSTNLDLSDEVF